MSDSNGELPEGWVMASLEEIGAVSSSRRVHKRDWREDGVPFYRAREVVKLSKEGFVDNELYISEELFKTLASSGQVPEAGDVLITGVGTIGVPYEVKQNDCFYFKDASVLIFKNYYRIESAYLFQAFRAPFWISTIHENSAGSTVKTLTIKQASKTKIPLAPLCEQRRIVGKIEALQERSRNAREALAEVKPLLEQFRQSLLAAAFRGDLTADWRKQNPDVEPASQLLERIRTERRAKWEAAELAKYEAKGKKPPKNWKEKYKEPEPVDDSDLPNLPEGWCWASFEEIANIESKLVSPQKYPTHPHVAPDNIEKETGRLLTFQTIIEDGVTSNKNHFFPGQIVYSKIRPYLSKVIVADFEGLCSADMYPISTPLNTQFLFRYMLSDFFLNAVQEEAGNRVVLPKVNQKQLYDVAVPVAPLQEQVEIASRVDEANSSKEFVTDQVASIQSALTQLDQSILAKAFRGELVPQDPNDEPASVLLDRIRQQREEAKPKKKTRTRKKKTTS